MTCLEWIAIILVIGFVSMIWTCIVSICLGKVVEKKMETYVQLEIQVFDKEMERLDKTFDKLINSVKELFEKDATK
ncbi:MAG: hypothetical protein LIR46_12895 [Bacteroidota bacterium]|nr:hypothetical protein [Bacteroidota bacterium]